METCLLDALTKCIFLKEKCDERLRHTYKATKELFEITSSLSDHCHFNISELSQTFLYLKSYNCILKTVKS